MRITIVMGFFLPMPPAAGGATEKTWHRLALEFARRGHEVTIVSRTWKNWPTDEIRDRVRHLRFRGADHTASLPRNLWRDLRWSLQLRGKLPAADITLINCVALPAILPPTAPVGRRVVMIGRLPKGQFRVYRRLDRVLAVSAPVLDAVRAENPDAAAKAIITGYPIDCRQLATPRASTSPAMTIGFIGRIHREKGLHLFVAALRQLAADPSLPPWRAIVCGPHEVRQGGSGPEYLAELRAKLGTAARPVPCEFRAPIFDETALAALYREFDVFCYPSIAIRGETFGVAVAEAMAAGAVPVVSSLRCFQDYLRPGENGVTFDHAAPDAVDRLAAALAMLLRDAPVRQRLAAAAQHAVARYDFPAYADRLMADFSALK